MRHFQPPAGTRFYAGVDLHARSLSLVILDHDGQTRFGRNLPAAPEPFLRAVAPFRDGLLVACEASASILGTGSPTPAATMPSPSPSATPGP